MDALLYRALTTDGCVMVAHRAAFEVVCLMARRPEWTQLIFDKLDSGEIYCTLMADKLIRIGRGDRREGWGLDDCMQYWGLPNVPDKESWWRLRYGLLYNTPCELWPQEAVDYAIGDVCVRDLYRVQQDLSLIHI